jgi:hypothetical protein
MEWVKRWVSVDFSEKEGWALSGSIWANNPGRDIKYYDLSIEEIIEIINDPFTECEGVSIWVETADRKGRSVGHGLPPTEAIEVLRSFPVVELGERIAVLRAAPKDYHACLAAWRPEVQQI